MHDNQRAADDKFQRMHDQWSELKTKYDALVKENKSLNNGNADQEQEKQSLRQQMEYLKGQYDELNDQLKQMTKDRNQFNDLFKSAEADAASYKAQMSSLNQEVKEIQAQEQLNAQKIAKLEASLKKQQKVTDDLTEVTKGMEQAYERMKQAFAPIESTLSCLSCLNYLSEPKPLTLVCGHSICRNCFNQHSDPNSQDSLVFCEDCKIETKNKMLRETKVTQILSSKFSSQKSVMKQIE